MILAKSDPVLQRTGRPPRADGRFFAFQTGAAVSADSLPPSHCKLIEGSPVLREPA